MPAQYYDRKKTDADKAAISSIRRHTTELEFLLMAPRGDFNWRPDANLIRNRTIALMMIANEISDRAEGIDFAPASTSVAFPG